MPQQQTSTAVLYIALLLSHHVHSSSAFRSYSEKPEDDNALSTALAQTSGEDAVSVASRSLADLMYGEAEEAGMAVSMDEAGWYCGWGYSKTMRWYHFEMDFQEKDGHTRHFAVELVRSPRAPRLLLHAGQTWSVRLTGDNEIPVDWVLSPLAGATGAAYTVEIDFRYDVKYIRSYALRDGGPRGLQVMFNNGTDFRLNGGLYYPDTVLSNSMWRNDGYNTPESPDEPDEENAGDVVGNVSAGGHAVKTGAGALGSAVAHHTGKFGTRGVVGGVAVGFGLSYGFSSAVALMNGILNAFLANIGVSSTVQVSIGIAPLTATQILTFTSYAGTLGLATGAAIGLGIGLIVGVPVGISTVVHEWIRQRREIHVSASEKIYAKLYCHRWFKACDSGGYIIVPYDKDCPDLSSLPDIE